MKHWKNLLVCLLAGVLALGVLTACSGLGSVNTGTDAEKAAELAQQLGVAHTQELDNTAKAVGQNGLYRNRTACGSAAWIWCTPWRWMRTATWAIRII